MDTKKETLEASCSELLHMNNQTIRYRAKVIGLMTTSPRSKIWSSSLLQIF